ncbi:uncharacterized protein [Arachis hypogaea]|uniref:uncharacterized protein n=1 Tax=Arachis hypogaea TaxID=3818 RepID=UPI003B21A692
MDLPRFENEYIVGVNNFLEFAFVIGKPVGKEIQCPYTKCGNTYWCEREDVYEHLICYGFVEGYKQWINHGESVIPTVVDSDMDDRGGVDDIDRLLRDAFGNTTNLQEGNNRLNEDVKRFYKLVDKAGLELYSNCTIGFLRLSFIIRLYHLKCLHGWSKTSFTSLLELLKEAIPDLNIHTSFNKAKNMVKDLGLDYKKIDACPNECMLYRNKYINDSVCDICGEFRYNQTPTMDGNEDDFALLNKVHKVAAKALRYFPLIPRLKRLFMCPNAAEALKWYDEQRLKDGCIRHPADGQAWKNLDTQYPNFSKELCNLRLGLASDGFNPFRTMNMSHSTWPIVLMVYNFPLGCP